MPSTLIIIGHDSDNLLQMDATALAAANGVVGATCSPKCQQSKPLVEGQSLLMSTYGLPVFTFSDDEALKPAELYVVYFEDDTKALNFVNSQSAFSNTPHRTVLLVTDTPAVDPAVLQANPYTLIVVGRDQSQRLNLDTSNLIALTECSNCQQTSVVVSGTSFSGTATWALSTSVALKPAETYVLRFPSEQAALAFVRSLPSTAELQRKTVVLIQPPPSAP